MRLSGGITFCRSVVLEIKWKETHCYFLLSPLRLAFCLLFHPFSPLSFFPENGFQHPFRSSFAYTVFLLYFSGGNFACFSCFFEKATVSSIYRRRSHHVKEKDNSETRKGTPRDDWRSLRLFALGSELRQLPSHFIGLILGKSKRRRKRWEAYAAVCGLCVTCRIRHGMQGSVFWKEMDGGAECFFSWFSELWSPRP